MDLSRIISINGRPGLFRLISQVKTNFIVEDLEKGIKLSVSQQQQVSLLENIAIYTTNDEIPLKEVFKNIAVLEKFEKCSCVKESVQVLREYMEKVLPNYDREKVYDSDLKKLFKWYNILQHAQIITKESVDAMGEVKSEEKPKKESKAKESTPKDKEEKPKKESKAKESTPKDKEEKPKKEKTSTSKKDE